jgi:hypothetical protein
MVRVNLSTLSHESVTCSRSPAISSTAFDTRPPDLPPASLMDTDFAIRCSLVRRRRPLIQFLSIGPYLCSTLPSDPTSPRRPCASLPFTSSRLGRDSHPQAVEHARRPKKRERGVSSFPSEPNGKTTGGRPTSRTQRLFQDPRHPLGRTGPRRIHPSRTCADQSFPP